nr:hypothetical protein [Nocardia acidivorans]
MTSRLLVVDAANVVGSRPDGWWRDRPGAARRLLTQLTELRLDEPTAIVVILEGAAKAAAAAYKGIAVVLAPASGDDTIVDTVTAARAAAPTRPITVVTADRGLRARLEPHNITIVGPRWLLDRID